MIYLSECLNSIRWNNSYMFFRFSVYNINNQYWNTNINARCTLKCRKTRKTTKLNIYLVDSKQGTPYEVKPEIQKQPFKIIYNVLLIIVYFRVQMFRIMNLISWFRVLEMTCLLESLKFKMYKSFWNSWLFKNYFIIKKYYYYNWQLYYDYKLSMYNVKLNMYGNKLEMDWLLSKFNYYKNK